MGDRIMNLIDFNTPVKLVGSLDFVNVYADDQKGLLFADWHGTIDADNIRTGFEFISNNLPFQNYRGLLNNNERLTAKYLGAINWLVTIWFPLLNKSGINNIAWVYSQERYTRISSEVLLRLCNTIKVETFNNIEEAEIWILNK